MQNLDLKKVLNGDDTEETNPVLNDRFEIKELDRTSATSKIYLGYDLVTDSEVIIKYRQGRAREQFVDSYSYMDEDSVPPLLWEETLGQNHVLIYERKGPDILTLFKKASNHFSPITTAMIFHLTVCSLEKIHSKKIIHTNLKPSKLLTNNDDEEEHRIYISGMEFCERISRVISKSQKPADLKAKRSNENLYSSISAHQNQSISYRDDLEALGYIICNLFSDGKLFGKFGNDMTDGTRKMLIKLKSNIRTEPLLTNMPSEFSDYFKYLQKLKLEDVPDYEHIKTLSFKLCQKLYVKNDIVSCFDWISIPEDQKSGYRAKMLSYFFCNTTKNSKKSSGKIDDILFNPKKRPAHVTKALLQTLQPDTHFKKNFQNMPILETQEEQNATKYYLDGFQLELDEEYSSCPSTPKLATKDKAFISKTTKLDKVRSTITEEEEKLNGNHPQDTLEKQKTTSSSGSVGSNKSLEESKIVPKSVPVSVPKSHQGILMSLTLNTDDRPPVPKTKNDVLLASKSLSHTTLKEYRAQLSVPGSKPDQAKLHQK